MIEAWWYSGSGFSTVFPYKGEDKTKRGDHFSQYLQWYYFCLWPAIAHHNFWYFNLKFLALAIHMSPNISLICCLSCLPQFSLLCYCLFWSYSILTFYHRACHLSKASTSSQSAFLLLFSLKSHCGNHFLSSDSTASYYKLSHLLGALQLLGGTIAKP